MLGDGPQGVAYQVDKSKVCTQFDHIPIDIVLGLLL